MQSIFKPAAIETTDRNIKNEFLFDLKPKYRKHRGVDLNHFTVTVETGKLITKNIDVCVKKYSYHSSNLKVQGMIKIETELLRKLNELSGYQLN